MTALLLIVKEYVSIYMVLLGLFCIFRLEKRYNGAVVAGFSGVYFVVETRLMENTEKACSPPVPTAI